MGKILITGAGGYIGSVATYLFLQNGYEVVAVDNYSTGYKKPLELLQDKFGMEKLRIYEADLNEDFSPIFEKETTEIKSEFDGVVHYAAHCLVDESMKKPGNYFRSNLLGTLNLLEAMVKFKVRNIIFSSTCAVYGEAEYVPVDEKHPTKPSNPYGESKLMAEKIIQWYGKIYDLRFMILRYFNVTGASDEGLIGDSKKPSTLLTQNAVRGALGINPFYLTSAEVDTPDKTTIRDYVNVVDLNEAHLAALQYLVKDGKNEIINLGTGAGNSVLEIVKTVEKVTGKKIELKKVTPRQGEYAKMVASINKAERILGWRPKRTIEDSIKSLVLWYQNHPNGWEK